MTWKKAARNKRRRKSVELAPPTPRLTLWKTSPATDLAFNDFLDRCPKELNIDADFPLVQLVNNGTIADPNNLFRTEELKRSWDIGLTRPDSYGELLTECVIWDDPSAKEKVQRYLNSAAENKYFDVPNPKDRPAAMYRGFYVIYPEGQEQKDPIFGIFGREPNFIKVFPLISKLRMAAVQYHNFMTGSDLEFSVFKKANLYFQYRMQTYYITFEATDNLSGKKVTCQSKVACRVPFQDYTNIKRDPVPIREIYVESFHRVED